VTVPRSKKGASASVLGGGSVQQMVVRAADDACLVVFRLPSVLAAIHRPTGIGQPINEAHIFLGASDLPSLFRLHAAAAPV
jgi:hypothetical protein